MADKFFRDMSDYYSRIASQLVDQAAEARFLKNSTDIGNEREEIYRRFLERHLPNICGVFLGGYVFDSQGRTSQQIDVIVTAGATPRFEMEKGDRQIAPVEGTIGVAEVKSKLDKEKLYDALGKIGSIPPAPGLQKAQPPYLRINDARWLDWPYKVVVAFDAIEKETLIKHVWEFYEKNSDISVQRRPNLIHVVGKYIIARITPDMRVLEPDGKPVTEQPRVGSYRWFDNKTDPLAMLWILTTLQENAFLTSHLMWKYDEWINRVADEILQRR